MDTMWIKTYKATINNRITQNTSHNDTKQKMPLKKGMTKRPKCTFRLKTKPYFSR